MTTLVVTEGPGSMDQYSFWLRHILNPPTLVTDIYQKSCEQRNIGWFHPKAFFTLWWDTKFLWALRGCGDIIHLPNHHLGRYAHFLTRPFIITVHDLIRWLDLERLDPYIHRPNTRDRFYLRLDFSALHKAARVIVPSHHTKRDLVQRLGLPEEKIAVIHHGVDTATFRPIQGKRPCDGPYILYVGSEHPRKNLPLVLRAFREMKRESRYSSLKFVKVGRPGGREHNFRADTLATIRSLGLEGEVIIKDFAPRGDLVSYYSQAQVLLFPSLYEGFGWPPLEAMACGCAVVASTAASVPEVVGNAAWLRDPHDVGGWVEALTQILTDSDTRRELVRKGAERVRQFSWEKAADLTRAIYLEVEYTASANLGHRIPAG